MNNRKDDEDFDSLEGKLLSIKARIKAIGYLIETQEHHVLPIDWDEALYGLGEIIAGITKELDPVIKHVARLTLGKRK